MRYINILSLVAVLFANIRCSDNPADADNTMGTLRVNVTDAPADFEQVLVTFSEVSVHNNSEWKIVSSGLRTIDLLKVTNGETALLAETQLKPGSYTQIQLKLTDAKVVWNGLTVSLTVPSSAQSGLKFNHAFEIKPGIAYALVIDFDAGRSIHLTGAGSLMMDPVIRVIDEETSGAIDGRVLNEEHRPIAYAIMGADTATSTYADSANGDFVLAYLPEGTYTVSVVDTLNRRFSTSGVVVTNGETSNLGQIALQ